MVPKLAQHGLRLTVQEFTARAYNEASPQTGTSGRSSKVRQSVRRYASCGRGFIRALRYGPCDNEPK